jgi:hypothetical protein
VPGGGGDPSIVARIKLPILTLASTAPVLISSAKWLGPIAFGSLQERDIQTRFVAADLNGRDRTVWHVHTYWAVRG